MDNNYQEQAGLFKAFCDINHIQGFNTKGWFKNNGKN